MARERHPDLASRRQERELFFWTAREVVKLILLVAVTVHTVVCLAFGRPVLIESLLRLL